MKRAAGGLLLSCAVVVGCVSARVPGLSLEKIPARSLAGPTDVLVLEPPSYSRSPSRRYPVLYFLHDGYGNARTLEAEGVAAELYRRMADGRLAEFLIVAPGAPGSWFSDSHDGKRLYERFLAADLPREIENRYRVRPGQSARAITGISMGGYGAFKLALKRPELYAAVSSLSGALIPFEPEDLARYNWFTRWTLKRVFGKDPRDNAFAQNDVWRILKDRQFESPPFAAHLRAGTGDVYGLGRVAAQFGSFLTDHGVPATVVLEPGGHDWSYWRRAMVAITEWHGKNFTYDAGR